MRIDGQSPGAVRIVLLEGNDEIRIDQNPTGCKEFSDLPVDGFESFDTAEIVERLERENRVEGADTFCPYVAPQVGTDKVYIIPMASRFKQILPVQDERRLDIDPCVFDGGGRSLTGCIS